MKPILSALRTKTPRLLALALICSLTLAFFLQDVAAQGAGSNQLIFVSNPPDGGALCILAQTNPINQPLNKCVGSGRAVEMGRGNTYSIEAEPANSSVAFVSWGIATYWGGGPTDSVLSDPSSPTTELTIESGPDIIILTGNFRVSSVTTSTPEFPSTSLVLLILFACLPLVRSHTRKPSLRF